MTALLPIVADLINSKKDAVHVVDESSLLNVFPQHVADGIIQAVENTHQYELQQASNKKMSTLVQG